MKLRRTHMSAFLLVVFIFLIVGYAAEKAVQAAPLQAYCTNKRTYLGMSAEPVSRVYDQGQQFAMTVNYKNAGTCTWDRDYRFVMIARPAGMGGRTVVRLPHAVPPGEDVRIEVDLTAPKEIDNHETIWQLQTPDGFVMSQVTFGFSVEDIKDQLYTGLGGFNLTSSVFCEEEPTLLGVDTVPDAATLTPGQSFKKVLRFRNDSDYCTWTEDYRIVNTSQNMIGGPRTVWFDGYVKPGETVALTIPLAAPDSPGEYSNRWELQAADGTPLASTTISAAVARPQQPPAPSSPGSTDDGPSQTAQCQDDYKFVADVTIPDGTVMEPGEKFIKVWRYLNTGSCTWGDDYQVSYYSGPRMNSPASFKLPKAVRPGETVDIAVSLVAPTATGKHKTRFQLHAPDGDAFAITSRPFVEIVVVD